MLQSDIEHKIPSFLNPDSKVNNPDDSEQHHLTINNKKVPKNPHMRHLIANEQQNRTLQPIPLPSDPHRLQSSGADTTE